MAKKESKSVPEPVSLRAALEAGKKVPPDATGLLTEDHRTVQGWFLWYDQAGDRSRRRQIVASICLALKAHAAAEEEAFYPAARGLIDPSLVDEAEQEHAEAKELIEQLEAEPGGEEEAELVRRLEAAVLHHVREEETRMFPAVREAGMDLYAVGAEVAAARMECLLALTATGRKAA